MQGTAAVLRRLDAIKDAISNGVPEAMTRHVSSLADKANAQYQVADNPNGSLDNDINVISEHEGSEWRIVASGSDLLFIEFGTGIIYPHTNPIEHPYNFAGSWSVDHGQFLTDSEKLAKYKGRWPYNGEMVDGNPSANIFYELGKEIEFSTTPVVSAEIGKAFK